MGETVIKVENIWKQYRLGTINSGTFKEDLGRWWRSAVLGRKDSPLPDDGPGSAGPGPGRKEFWALQDITFEVNKGEVIGIIGKNGAGKSTLLKILSRVTRPTRGRIRGIGRVASLLEVGTGFHEELTGRENIFLNGNILGMANREIREKLDQIIAFSGVEKFIDTPVKRYSSGMYVRLAFAVAAHLEPEILIVDEVLAVGDAEFQKRCLGKMNDISKREGCTVIFVSHNMVSIQTLCSRVILIEQGRVTSKGKPAEVVSNYIRQSRNYEFRKSWPSDGEAPGNQYIRIRNLEIRPEWVGDQSLIDIRTPLHICFAFTSFSPEINLCIGVHLYTISGDCIFDVSSVPEQCRAGDYEGKCTIPGHFLNDGAYYISLIFVKDTSIPLFCLEECLSFEVEDYRENYAWFGKWMGHVRPAFPVIIRPIAGI
ncbi:MAG TPA: ABC transporter ATP-binding protein [Chitinophagaceae bacterium]|nr:ABC transporter ATP-binding protein [Chitinophagaceae bacterium]